MISYPSATYSRAWRSASCAPRPGRKPKLDAEKVGSRSGSSTCRIACCTRRSTTVGMPNWRIPAARLGDFHPAHRLRLVAAVQQRGDQLLAVPAIQRTQFVDGHPVHARRALVRLHPLVGSVQVRGAGHLLHQMFASRLVLGPTPRTLAAPRALPAPVPPSPAASWRSAAFRASSRRSRWSTLPCCRSTPIESVQTAPCDLTNSALRPVARGLLWPRLTSPRPSSPLPAPCSGRPERRGDLPG